MGAQGKYGNDNPLPPSEETRLSWSPTIAEDQKLGVYVLAEVNFKTFDETTLDAPFPPGTLKFEVVPDLGADQPNIEEDLVEMKDVAASIIIKELSIQLARGVSENH